MENNCRIDKKERKFDPATRTKCTCIIRMGPCYSKKPRLQRNCKRCRGLYFDWRYGKIAQRGSMGKAFRTAVNEVLFHERGVIPRYSGRNFQFSRDNGMKVAFTSFTAGAIYTNYSVRYDSVYLYLQREDFKKFSNTFATNESSGIKIHLYRPDRSLWDDTRMLQGIPVVSPAQALLDLAGLGYSGRDLALRMVENLAAY